MGETKILCALVPTPDGGRVLCKVLDYPINNTCPPYKPLARVRALRGKPFHPATEILAEINKIEFKFVKVQS